MGRIITVVLTLCALSFLVYRAVGGHKTEAGETSAPKRQLDNVRGAATRIEANDQQHVDDIAKKTESP